MATTTITTTAAEDARIATAVGKYLGLVDGNGDPRNATLAEVKTLLMSHLKSIVRSVEYGEAEEAARAGVTDIAPT